MKRYEKMTKEEIIKFIDNIAKIDFCLECPIMNYCREMSNMGCSETFTHYLQEEVSVKPRFMTFRSAEEFRKAIQEIEKVIEETDKECKERGHCDGCKYYKGNECIEPTLEDWLCEEIEIEE